MDLYRGLVDPLAPDTHQIHDFNLDITPFPDGLFWTRKVDAASVDVDPAHRDRPYFHEQGDSLLLDNSFASTPEFLESRKLETYKKHSSILTLVARARV